MNRRQKLKTVEQTLKVLTEGKEEILLENPLIASLLRMGLTKYLFGDTVDKVVGKIKSSKDDTESASDILKKAGLDVKADDDLLTLICFVFTGFGTNKKVSLITLKGRSVFTSTFLIGVFSDHLNVDIGSMFSLI